VEHPKTTALAGEALSEPPDRNARHAALFERVAARIYRYFLKTVWSPTEAEDLAQRTLLELERSLRESTYDPSRSWNGWMWLKAHTVFAQWCRERERRSRPRPDPVDAREPASETHTSAIEARLDAETILREVQRRLGDESWEIFLLAHESGLSQAEVAHAVGRDKKTVASRLAEARALIKGLLRDGGKP
jgi:RNA polymerase sigma factor (sigma-70 family)